MAKFYLEIKRKKFTVEGVMSGLSLVEDLESLTIKYLGMQLISYNLYMYLLHEK